MRRIDCRSGLRFAAAGIPGSVLGALAAGGEVYRYRVPLARGTVYSAGVGSLPSFLGIGGGVIHVPLMAGALGFPTHVATATRTSSSSGCRGRRAPPQLGARLSRRFTGPTIRKLLGVALLGLAVRLLISAVS